MKSSSLFLVAALCLIFNHAYPQSHQPFIVTYDTYPFDFPLKHMVVRQHQEVACHDFLKITQITNGYLDSLQHNPEEGFILYIVPTAPGPVTVKAICTIIESGRKHLSEVIATFKALAPPLIEVELPKQNILASKLIKFQLFNSQTGELAENRYQISQYFDVKVFDKKHQLVGIIPMQSGSPISLKFGNKIKFKKGFTLLFTLPIGDEVTGVLFNSREIKLTL
ncbi:hypothetical protein [Nibribacter koreensis]